MNAHVANQLQSDPVDAFRFQLIDRFMDAAGMVSYKRRVETILSVPNPLEIRKEVRHRMISRQVDRKLEALHFFPVKFLQN